MEHSKKIVVRNGISPSEEFKVIAYGDEAFYESIERGLVEKRPYWDGLGIGGQYAVLSKDIPEQDVRDISQLHDEDTVGDTIEASTGNGEMVEVQIADASDL
jgi:hypothetical protein